MAGYWFDDERLLGFEAGGFWLQSLTSSYAISSSGAPGSLPLYRPFVDPNFNPGLSTREIIAVPGLTSGGYSRSLRSSLWGAEANLRSNLLCDCDFFLDGIVGARTVSLREDLAINESVNLLVPINDQVRAGTSTVILDRFKTQNTFYGGQFGLVSEFRKGKWSVNLMGKVGLGVTQQTVDISGSQTVIPPAGSISSSSVGVFAVSSNIGNHTRNVFSVVPELGLNLGYQITEHLRLFVGYNYLYWSKVVRPGPQIDLVVNRNLQPGQSGAGPARPAFTFNNSDFWVQGVTFGLEYRY
jgi:hypothetical protein